jgi:hypothetical protein
LRAPLNRNSDKPTSHPPVFSYHSFIAASKNHVDLCAALLARGADLQEVIKPTNQTPLMHALMHGSVEVAKFFLDKGAKKDQSFDFCGCTVRE